MRKTGNEIERVSGGRRFVNPFTGADYRFFTKVGATQKKFHDLGNLAWQRGPVRMLVSIPFRDV